MTLCISDEGPATPAGALEYRAPELTGPYGEHYKNILTAVRAALPETQATDAQAHGAGMTYAEAANFALESVATAQADQAKV